MIQNRSFLFSMGFPSRRGATCVVTSRRVLIVGPTWFKMTSSSRRGARTVSLVDAGCSLEAVGGTSRSPFDHNIAFRRSEMFTAIVSSRRGGRFEAPPGRGFRNEALEFRNSPPPSSGIRPPSSGIRPPEFRIWRPRGAEFLNPSSRLGP